MTVALHGFALTASLRHPLMANARARPPIIGAHRNGELVLHSPTSPHYTADYVPHPGDEINAYSGQLTFTVVTVTWNQVEDEDKEEYGYTDSWKLVADPASTSWYGPFSELVGGGMDFLRTEVSYPGDLPITLLDALVEQDGELVPRVVTMQAYLAARSKAEATWAKAPRDLLIALAHLDVHRDAVLETLTHLALPSPSVRASRKSFLST